MAVGAHIMLRRNISTADGLVNGAMCTVVGFEWPQADANRIPGEQPIGIHVQ